MGIVAIFFPRAYGKANRVIPRKHRTINPVAPHVSFLPRVEVAQAARRIARATKPRNRSPISARYYKFESISLQQTVRLSPDFAFVPGKARVLRRCGDEARQYGRQRPAKSSNIALRSGSVSVGRYFSTAVSPMRFAPVGTPPPSAVAPLEIQRYR